MRWHEDRPVYRTRPLPEGDLDGVYLVPTRVLEITGEELTRFALAGIHERGHEGLVFWCGRETEELIVFTTVVVPEVEHSHGRVSVSHRAFGIAARRARAAGVFYLCQVHSHPGSDARHSDGDDDLVGMPREGMLSIVVPNFGIGLTELADLAVHQFQGGQWVLCSASSVQEQMRLVPGKLDLRP